MLILTSDFFKTNALRSSQLLNSAHHSSHFSEEILNDSEISSESD